LNPILSLRGVSKAFTLHQRDSTSILALKNVDLDVFPGDCIVLEGGSGSGKSTLLKLVHGNYRATSGSIRFDHAAARAAGYACRESSGLGCVDLCACSERQIIELRRTCIGYVSQFLRAIPRVSASDVVAEPLISENHDDDFAQRDAAQLAHEMLARLRLDSALWQLPPATFSGGEQQRVNLARGLIKQRPLLLLDEPTASLDGENRQVVVDLIQELRRQGAAIVGIFHDRQVSEAVATRRISMNQFK
jgi:alpha-D-ribose 1-methylphosphonate 5-triphosphate synthase subunit PhnL